MIFIRYPKISVNAAFGERHAAIIRARSIISIAILPIGVVVSEAVVYRVFLFVSLFAFLIVNEKIKIPSAWKR